MKQFDEFSSSLVDYSAFEKTLNDIFEGFENMRFMDLCVLNEETIGGTLWMMHGMSQKGCWVRKKVRYSGIAFGKRKILLFGKHTCQRR